MVRSQDEAQQVRPWINIKRYTNNLPNPGQTNSCENITFIRTKQMIGKNKNEARYLKTQ